MKMKIYLVVTGYDEIKCFDSYEEAKKCVEIYNRIHNANLEVEEAELQQQYSNPSEYYVKALAKLPYIGIAYGDENVEKLDRMSHYIEIKSDIEEFYSDKYEVDTTKTYIYSSYISIYFYFKLPFVKDESKEELDARAKQLFLEKLDEFKSKKEFEEVVEISHIYVKMKEKIDNVSKTIDK